MIDVQLFTKDPCSLCDEVKEMLHQLAATYPHQLTEIDITTDHDTFATYRFIIPVLKIGSTTLKAPIQQMDLVYALRNASRRL